MNPSSSMEPFEHDGRCYMASKAYANYEDARKTCRALNGTYELVSIVSAVEHRFVAFIQHTLKLSLPWIGLKGFTANMSWSDGLPFDFGSDYKFPWTDNPNWRPNYDVSRYFVLTYISLVFLHGNLITKSN